jgi:YHS domain-containing protein
MKKVLFAAALLVIAGFVLATAQQPAWAKEQANCPVMGAAVNKNIYVDHNGKRVYFCCNGCPEAFKKDPDKFIKKLESEGVELEKVPAQGK